MNLKRFIKKNLVLIIVLLLVLIFSIAYFKKEGFGKPECKCPSGSFIWNNECYYDCSSRVAGSTRTGRDCAINPRTDKKISSTQCNNYNGIYENRTCYYCPTDTTTSTRPKPSSSTGSCIYNTIPT